MKKTKVFKIKFDGGSCFVFNQEDITSIIQHEIIEQNPIDAIGDKINISLSVGELTDKEIEDAGEFDGF